MKSNNPRFTGRKHTAESNEKRSETIKKMYAEGITSFGFKQKYTTYLNMNRKIDESLDEK